jgi:3-carboxy-cis,cis-muconate cycloisomerase
LPSEPGLFGGIYARGEAAAQLTDEAWLQAMLDFEAALARGCVKEGLIPAEEAERIAAACLAERFDLAELGRRTAEHATPVVPLVAALRDAIAPAPPGAPEPGNRAHLGATSQDTVDTAAMLLAHRALGPVLADADAARAAAARLARQHADTPMVGRTLLQQALPVSFGLVAAGWAHGISQARMQLVNIRARELAVQLGGPVGSRPPALAAHVAAELGLAEPALPWHTIRVLPATLAGALGVLAGVLGKVARDATLLSQQEVGEVSEGGDPGRGGSTAMAHKHNPVAAVSLLACTKRVPGLVATMLASMEQEHQRAAGAWQAEWGTLTDLLRLTGSAAAWGRELLEQLTVDPERMRENLSRLARAGVEEALDPERHLGGARELIDRALAERDE